jgi:hypothetical protein
MRLKYIVVVFSVSLPTVYSQGLTNSEPIGLAKVILADSAYSKMATFTNEHFRLHYEPHSLAGKHLDELSHQAEAARTLALMLLGEQDFRPVLDLFYIHSRRQMKEIIGVEAKGWTDYRSKTIVLVYNDSTRAYHNHEMMHAVVLNLWGFPADSNHCFIEGAAVYADNPCLGEQIHEIAAYLFYERELIAFRKMFTAFRKQKDMQSYMEAGSIVQYILETYGRDKFKALWQRGIGRSREILGRSFEEIEKDYIQFLRMKYPLKPEVPWPVLLAKGCG